jgi:hypothetical protein
LGYAGTGFDGTNALQDFYQYDPSSDSWKTVGFSGQARSGAVCWVYNNQAYIATGANGGTMQTDFWVFDPGSDTSKWTELRPIFNSSDYVFDDAYTNIARKNGAVFVIGSSAYLSTGENGANNPSTWEYDMAINPYGVRDDIWFVRTPFEGPATTGAIGFSLNSTSGGGGFILIPETSSGKDVKASDLWQFIQATPPNPNDN